MVDRGFLKRCACGAVYDLKGWRALAKQGYVNCGDGEFLEMRGCVCRSSICVEIKYERGRVVYESKETSV